MKTAVAAVAGTFTWCQEFGVVWVVQGILEGGNRYALGVLESHVGDIPVWLVLKHPRLCQDLVDLLHCAPAAPASHVPQGRLCALDIQALRSAAEDLRNLQQDRPCCTKQGGCSNEQGSDRLGVIRGGALSAHITSGRGHWREEPDLPARMSFFQMPCTVRLVISGRLASQASFRSCPLATLL